jgi:hypothetical protein
VWTHLPEDLGTAQSILSEATSGAGQGVGSTVLRVEAEQASKWRCLSNDSNAGNGPPGVKDMPAVHKVMRKGWKGGMLFDWFMHERGDLRLMKKISVLTNKANNLNESSTFAGVVLVSSQFRQQSGEDVEST